MKVIREVIPADSYKSIELLLQENPTMVASDILLEFEHGKKCYQAGVALQNKENTALAQQLQTHKYYRLEYAGKSNTTFYVEITKAWVDHGEVYVDLIESVLSNNSVLGRPEGLSIETLTPKTYQEWHNYSPSRLTALTKGQYEAFLASVALLFDGEKAIAAKG